MRTAIIANIFIVLMVVLCGCSLTPRQQYEKIDATYDIAFDGVRVAWRHGLIEKKHHQKMLDLLKDGDEILDKIETQVLKNPTEPISKIQLELLDMILEKLEGYFIKENKDVRSLRNRYNSIVNRGNQSNRSSART